MKKVILSAAMMILLFSSCGVYNASLGNRDFRATDLFFETYKPKESVSDNNVMVLVATGHGALDTRVKNPSQQHLMAMRVSEVDAYRALAERLNGINITGATKVKDFVATYDHLHTMVEAYIQNASIISQELTDKGFYETTLSLRVDRNFLNQFHQPVTAAGMNEQSGYSKNAFSDSNTQKNLDRQINNQKSLDTQSTREQHYQIGEAPSR